MIVFGQILTFLCGGILWILFVGTLMNWLGSIFGFFAGIIFSPGVVIFPLVYRLIEGAWPPTIYFGLYILGMLGVIISFSGGWLNPRD